MKNWKNVCVFKYQSILEVMQIIDREACQFAMVIDEQNKLLGTVTDGDIRRAILRGTALTEPSELAMNKNPATARFPYDETALLSILKKKKINHIPIVDSENIVIDVKSLNDFQDIISFEKENPIVLMAGGLGTRLGELTANCPKPLLKVGQKPILEIILDNFKAQGFRNFYISVNYKSEMIEEYFKDGADHNVTIKYLKEEQKLGTAGALSLIRDKIEAPMIVMNGDLLTKIDFNQLLNYHQLNKHVATMCVRQYEFQVPYGVVQTNNDQITRIDEKPTQHFFVNAGIYVLDPKLIDRIPTGSHFDMPTLFNDLLEEKKSVGAFPVHEYWLDIGQKDDFEKAQYDVIKF